MGLERALELGPKLAPNTECTEGFTPLEHPFRPQRNAVFASVNRVVGEQLEFNGFIFA